MNAKVAILPTTTTTKRTRLGTCITPSQHVPVGAIKIKLEDDPEKVGESCGSVRRALWERVRDNRSFPLPSTSSLTRVTIGTLGAMLNLMKESVDWAQFLPKGRKGTLPSIRGTKIKKVAVPRLALSYQSDGQDGGGNQVFKEINTPMNAEWVWNRESSNAASQRVVLYMHGGAYVLSSRRTHRGITSRIAKYADARVFSIDYRLAPQHVFPGPLIDVLSAYQFLLKQGFQPQNITFCGDSAGGGLSTAAMLYCRDSARMEKQIPMPGCLAVMSPYTDMTQSLPSWQVNKPYDYLPDAVKDPKYFTDTRSNLAVGHDQDLINPYASPAFAKSNSKIPICPTLIQVGDAERVRDDGVYFATESMSASEPIQVELYEDCVHVFQLFCQFDAFSDIALQRLSQFIKAHTGTDSDVARQEFKRGAVKVFNDRFRNYPAKDIPDLHGILSDGVHLCLEKKIWKFNQKTNAITL